MSYKITYRKSRREKRGRPWLWCFFFAAFLLAAHGLWAEELDVLRMLIFPRQEAVPAFFLELLYGV